MSFTMKSHKNGKTQLPSISSSFINARESHEIHATQLLSPLEQNQKLKAEHSQLEQENSLLNAKFSKLKANIVALKQNLETSIYNQLDEKSNQIIQLSSQIEDASQTINALTSEAEGMTPFYSQQKKLRLKLFGVINQKMKEENYYLKQEEIVKSLEEKYKGLRETKKKKEEVSILTEDKYYKMYSMVEENKEIISKLKSELIAKTRLVKQRIDVLNSKEMEITSLKSNLQFLKTESEEKYQNELKLKTKLKKISEENKQLNSFFHDNTNTSVVINRKVNDSMAIHENEQSMKQDDENMKELTGMVKNILDE